MLALEVSCGNLESVDTQMEVSGTFCRMDPSDRRVSVVRTSTATQRRAVQARRPADKAAGKKIHALLSNIGTSPEAFGAQAGISGKQLRRIIDEGFVPERRLRYAIARRFELLPADIWKQDRGGLSPHELDHLRGLAERADARKVIS